MSVDVTFSDRLRSLGALAKWVQKKVTGVRYSHLMVDLKIQVEPCQADSSTY